MSVTYVDMSIKCSKSGQNFSRIWRKKNSTILSALEPSPSPVQIHSLKMQGIRISMAGASVCLSLFLQIAPTEKLTTQSQPFVLNSDHSLVGSVNRVTTVSRATVTDNNVYILRQNASPRDFPTQSKISLVSAVTSYVSLGSKIHCPLTTLPGPASHPTLPTNQQCQPPHPTSQPTQSDCLSSLPPVDPLLLSHSSIVHVKRHQHHPCPPVKAVCVCGNK